MRRTTARIADGRKLIYDDEREVLHQALASRDLPGNGCGFRNDPFMDDRVIIAWLAAMLGEAGL